MSVEEMMVFGQHEAERAGLAFTVSFDPGRGKWRAQMGGFNVERPSLSEALLSLLTRRRWER